MKESEDRARTIEFNHMDMSNSNSARSYCVSISSLLFLPSP